MPPIAPFELDAKRVPGSTGVRTTDSARRPTGAPTSRSLERRLVEPEWLDQLPPAEPAAQRARIDLRRVNAWMGNARHIVQALRSAPFPKPPRRLADIGAGDGTLLLELARQMAAQWPAVEAVLVDRQDLLAPSVRDEFRRLGWTVRAVPTDVHEWFHESSGMPGDVVLANLFLHHFKPERLRRLLQAVAGRACVFVACEPERSRWSRTAARLLPFIGCSQVTLHDAVVSVHAGFRGRELSSLWPDADGWQFTERRVGWFSHLFVACHRT